mgnify:CR=1 FL=1
MNDSCDVQTVLKQYDITCQTLEHLSKYTDEEMQAAGFKTLGSLSESLSNILADKENIINQAIQRNFDKEIDSLTTTTWDIHFRHQMLTIEHILLIQCRDQFVF